MTPREEALWGRLDAFARENQSQQEMINHLYRITVIQDKRTDELVERIKELEAEKNEVARRLFELEMKGDDGK